MTNRWTFTNEHRAKVPAWNKVWIDRIMSTEAMTPDDWSITTSAIEGMYAAAGLAKPIVIPVLSPMMAVIVGACADAYWAHVGERDPSNSTKEATRTATGANTAAAIGAATAASTGWATAVVTAEATEESAASAAGAITWSSTAVVTATATALATDTAAWSSTRAATTAATEAVASNTWAVTETATRAVTVAAAGSTTAAATAAAAEAVAWAATESATESATWAATWAVTREATREAIMAVTDNHIEWMWNAALSVVNAKAGVDLTSKAKRIAKNWYDNYNGGCEWAAWCSYLSFVRDVIGWSHPSHANYRHYELAAIHSGPRYMHRRFCLVSDRAKTRRIDDRNQPHCETGPAIEWRCGTQAWYFHGVLVDEQIIMRPETQTIDQIDRETNQDVRSIRITRYGWERYLSETGADCIDSRRNNLEGTTEYMCRTKKNELVLLTWCPSTKRRYALPLPNDAGIQTCAQAQNWGWSLPLDSDPKIVYRT